MRNLADGQSARTSVRNTKFDASGRLYAPVMNRRVLLFVAVFYTLGIVFGARWTLSIWVYLLMGASFLIGGILLLKQGAGKYLLYSAVIFLGMAMITNAFTVSYPPIDISSPVLLEGRVTRRIDREQGATYRLTNVTIYGEEISGDISVYTMDGDYSIDDILLVQATLRIPEKADYPGGFDDFRYTRGQNILYRGTAGSSAKIGEASGFLAWVNGLRRSLSDQVDKVFDEDHAPMIKALVIGEEEDIDQETYDIFSLAGITHILSISGSHILLLCGTLGWLLTQMKVPRKVRFIMEQVFLIFYLLLTGLQISMVRAAIMYEFLLIGKFYGKQRDTLTFLSAALLIVLIWNPAWAFDLGLQLSFGAVFGLVCLTTPIERALKIGNKTLSAAVASGFAANISLFPILTNLNNYFWIPSLLINTAATLYAIPLIPGLMVLVALTFIWPHVALLRTIGNWMVDILTYIAKVGLPLGAWKIYLPAMGFTLVLAWFVLLYVSSRKVWLPTRIKGIGWAVVAVCYLVVLFMPVGIGGAVTFTTVDDGTLVVQTEDGAYWLIGASEDAYGYTLHNYGRPASGTFASQKSREEMDGVVALAEARRSGVLYSFGRTTRILEEKYALVPTPVLGAERVGLSGRCGIAPIYQPWDAGERRVVGFHIDMDGAPFALVLYEYVEGLEKLYTNGQILYLGAMYEKEIPLKMQFAHVVGYGKDWFPTEAENVYNVYQTGALTVRVSRSSQVRVEAMYG